MLVVTNPILLWLFKHGWEDPGWGLSRCQQICATAARLLPSTIQEIQSQRVALANERLVRAHISGKMRKRFIRLTFGDRMKMEMSPHDTAKARIVYRL